MPSPGLPLTTQSERLPLSASIKETHARISPYGLREGENCVSSALLANGPTCLSDRSLAEFDRIALTTSFPEGAVLLVEGQVPRGVYVLCQGRVKLMTTSRDGRTIITRIAQRGETLGSGSVLTSRPYELTIETLQPSQLAFIDSAAFLRFIKERADACLHVARQLSNECQTAYDVIRLVGAHTVQQKLARLLLQWSADGRVAEGSIPLRISLTHEEVAQLIGSTRETVTRTLGELKKRRVLELTGTTLLILDNAALEALAEA